VPSITPSPIPQTALGERFEHQPEGSSSYIKYPSQFETDAGLLEGGNVDGEVGEGLCEIDGIGLGEGVGLLVGNDVVGNLVGLGDGINEGLEDGFDVVGNKVGLGDGLTEGLEDGFHVVGIRVGLVDGRALGIGVGGVDGINVGLEDRSV